MWSKLITKSSYKKMNEKQKCKPKAIIILIKSILNSHTSDYSNIKYLPAHVNVHTVNNNLKKYNEWIQSDTIHAESTGVYIH